MWSDNETTIDMIGFDIHAKLIKEVITNPNLLPTTIGIFGDWGSGKTSILKMLENELNPNPIPEDEKEKLDGVVCLYFNSWVFEGFEDAKSAIMSSVLAQLADHKKFGEKVKENMGKVVKSINWIKLVKLGIQDIAIPLLTGGFSLVPSALKLIGGETEEDKTPIIDVDKLLEKQSFDEVQMHVRKFREDFEELIEKSTIKILVILIDDLDRCTPERIVENLEAIKLFLNVKQTAFIISADPRIVRHAIAIRYKDVNIVSADNEGEISEYSTNDLIGDYIEKLIQVPYYLPKLSPSEIETYMSLLFCSKELDKGTMQKVLCEHKKCWDSNRFSIFGEVALKNLLGEDKSYDPLYSCLSFCSTSASLITEGLKGNPRQVKRFLNAYILRKQMSTVAKMHNFRDDVLVKLMILEYSQPKLFNHLYKLQVEGNGYPKQIKEIENLIAEKEGSVTAEVIGKIDSKLGIDLVVKWMKMRPSLTDIDLRDYFWISRDKLQSSLSGVTFISPFIKKAAEDLLSDNQGRIVTILKTIADLGRDDLEILYDCVKDYVKRNPSKKNGYDAVIALIENKIEGSISLLNNILTEIKSTDIPAAVGVAVSSIYKRNIANSKDILHPILEKLKQEKNKFGVALKKDMES
jgi:hypothetical protein